MDFGKLDAHSDMRIEVDQNKNLIQDHGGPCHHD